MEIPSQEAIEKQQRWQEKLSELCIPDEYGYVIEEGIRETVAAAQLLGINTRQSCEGNAAPYPWIEFGAVEPKNIYEGEQEVKGEIMGELGITASEIDPSSPEYDRAKQVDVEEPARERLSISDTPFTPEYAEWSRQTLEDTEKLQGLIKDFYDERPAEDGSRVRVCINYPYRSPDRPAHIRDIPFLEVQPLNGKIKDLSKEEKKQLSVEYKNEMRRFTEFLKGKVLL